MYEEDKTYYCKECGKRLFKRYDWDIDGRIEVYYCPDHNVEATQKQRKKFSKRK